MKYVAVGASDSVGVGSERPAEQAWPVLVSKSLPDGSTFVNVAVDGSITAEALNTQLPKAVAENPDVVTVWLNVNDLIRQVSPAQYETQLRRLLEGLRRNGETEVFVANTPPVSSLPVLANARGGPYGSFIPGADQIDRTIAAYNEVIERVASETGATVVDLHQQGLDAQTSGEFAGLISSDGFHPSTKGHEEVARAFAKAIAGRR